MDAISPEYGSGLPSSTIEVKKEVEVAISSNGFNYKNHNEALRTRWFQLRVTKEMEFINRMDAAEPMIPTLRLLDRFISLSINRARTDGEEEQVLTDVRELKGYLDIIDGSPRG